MDYCVSVRNCLSRSIGGNRINLPTLFLMRGKILFFSIVAVGFISMMESTSGTDTLVTIGSIDVKYDSVDSVISYTSGMTIDADGSPRAYHPVSDSGLDALANAGHKGNWWGIVTDAKGIPVVQGKNDSDPGYYVSTTSLQDASKKITDPARYVNSDSIPYIVLPNNKSVLALVHKGDFAYVKNIRNGKTSAAIFADVGPKDKIGEGSMKLAENLGINSNPRTGGIADSVQYFVFPGSGNGKPRSYAEIDSLGRIFFNANGTTR